MVNVWGYSTINFFSPMRRYASVAAINSVDAAREFKEMVKALHANGIEVQATSTRTTKKIHM